MSASFLQAIKVRYHYSLNARVHTYLTVSSQTRRTYYGLSKASPISDAQIKAIVDAAATDVPSAFNMQSARVVLLTGKSNDKLWEIVKTGYIATLGGNGA